MDLKYIKKSSIEKLSRLEQDDMYIYADEYIKFLNSAKTEYECVESLTNELEEADFVNIKDISETSSLKPGDKVYFVNKERAIYAAIIGENDINEGLNIVGAHIDSPRLDTKPMPLFEKQSLAMMKTQYYGGIKKYQWLAIPLAMHGVIYNEKGERIKIVVGEKENEPVFTIADLLPHLSKEEDEKKASQFIDPENLSVIVGSLPDNNEKEEKVKQKILKILNKKYGICEIDFARSDISFVPNFKASYVGFDMGLIAGYGQDDRVCSYACMSALINIAKSGKTVNKTAIALLVDKEEIGSEGSTSMKSSSFDLFILSIVNRINLGNENNILRNMSDMSKLYGIYNNSCMLSADVSSAVDPSHEEVSDIQNANIIGSGISIEKYSGSGGKYHANDASAKYMSYIMNLFDKNNISYQLGTLGKIEKGGGGTIAYILANKGMEVVDCGTALLSMHSPYEVSSVPDVYMTYKAYKTFFSV